MRALHTPAEWKARSHAAAALTLTARTAALLHRWRRSPAVTRVRGDALATAHAARKRRAAGLQAWRCRAAQLAVMARVGALAFGNSRVALLRKVCGAWAAHTARRSRARAAVTGGGARTWLARARDGGGGGGGGGDAGGGGGGGDGGAAHEGGGPPRQQPQQPQQPLPRQPAERLDPSPLREAKGSASGLSDADVAVQQRRALRAVELAEAGLLLSPLSGAQAAPASPEAPEAPASPAAQPIQRAQRAQRAPAARPARPARKLAEEQAIEAAAAIRRFEEEEATRRAAAAEALRAVEAAAAATEAAAAARAAEEIAAVEGEERQRLEMAEAERKEIQGAAKVLQRCRRRLGYRNLMQQAAERLVQVKREAAAAAAAAAQKLAEEQASKAYAIGRAAEVEAATRRASAVEALRAVEARAAAAEEEAAARAAETLFALETAVAARKQVREAAKAGVGARARSWGVGARTRVGQRATVEEEEVAEEAVEAVEEAEEEEEAVEAEAKAVGARALLGFNSWTKVRVGARTRVGRRATVEEAEVAEEEEAAEEQEEQEQEMEAEQSVEAATALLEPHQPHQPPALSLLRTAREARLWAEAEALLSLLRAFSGAPSGLHQLRGAPPPQSVGLELLAQRRRLQGWRRWHLALCSRQFELRIAALGDRRMRHFGLRCLRRAARAAAARWRAAVAAWRRRLLARCCAGWRRHTSAWLAWSAEAVAAQATLRLQRGAVRALTVYHARKRHRRHRVAAARRVLEGRVLVRLLRAWRGCVVAKLRVRACGAAVAAELRLATASDCWLRWRHQLAARRKLAVALAHAAPFWEYAARVGAAGLERDLLGRIMHRWCAFRATSAAKRRHRYRERCADSLRWTTVASRAMRGWHAAVLSNPNPNPNPNPNSNPNPNP